MSDDLPSLVAAASLLLAVIAILFGVWYPDLAPFIDLTEEESKRPSFREDAEELIATLHGLIRTRALPLAVACAAVTLVFLPDAIGVVVGSTRELARQGLAAGRHYDAVATSLVLVVVFSSVLAGYLICLAVRLRRLEVALKGLPRAGG